MSGTPDGELVQQYVRDLQVVAGHVPADRDAAERLLLGAVSRLASPSSPIAYWTIRGLTVTAVARVAGARLRLIEDSNMRLQHICVAASVEEMRTAVIGLITTLRICQHPSGSDGRATVALAYMRAHLHEPALTLDAVSATLRLSRWHLGRLLQRETGATYRQLLRQMRLEQACALLRDPSRSVKEVAAAVGYAYTTELDRDFRRTVGASPSQWRRRSPSGPHAGANVATPGGPAKTPTPG